MYQTQTTNNQTSHATSYHPHPNKTEAFNLLNIPLNEKQYNEVAAVKCMSDS